MTYKVKFTHNDKSHAHITSSKIREGTEVYRHPEGSFVVLEFQGNSGKFREAFWPEDIAGGRQRPCKVSKDTIGNAK